MIVPWLRIITRLLRKVGHNLIRELNQTLVCMRCVTIPNGTLVVVMRRSSSKEEMRRNRWIAVMVLCNWREGRESMAMRSPAARRRDCIREVAGRRPERTTVDSGEGISMGNGEGRGKCNGMLEAFYV